MSRAGPKRVTDSDMYVSIGRKQPAADLVEALLECHDRIRTFLEIAGKLAATPEAPPAEVREAAQRVRRYFAEALPRHVADEEESILPRLAGKHPELDAALARMHAEHHEHARPLATLLDSMQKLDVAPERLSELAPELARVAAELDAALGAHLENEEAIVFPAIRAELSPEDQAAIRSELAARRAR